MVRWPSEFGTGFSRSVFATSLSWWRAGLFPLNLPAGFSRLGLRNGRNLALFERDRRSREGQPVPLITNRQSHVCVPLERPLRASPRYALCAAAIAFALSTAASAAPPSRDQQLQLLLDAQRAFDRGAALRRADPSEAQRAFRESAEAFAAVADSGMHSSNLYYNLGNAWLEAGHVGRAIVNYRRAERLAPGDGELEHNLRTARSMRANQIAVSGERALWDALLSWHDGTAVRTRFVFALAAYMLFWLLLVIQLFARRFRWILVLAPLAILWIVPGASVAWDTVLHGRPQEGVIIANDVIARKGNSEGFEPQFEQTLHEGVEFILIERRGDWFHVELPDGNTGWVKAAEAELI